MKFGLLILFMNLCNATGYLQVAGLDSENRRTDMIVDIITFNLKKNGWSTILCFGNLPDAFYNKLNIRINTSYTFTITKIDHEDKDMEDVVQYYANTIIINLLDIKKYEKTILKLVRSPYWHPHANIIIYYHEQDRNVLSNIYFALWYYKAVNVIIVQYNDTLQVLQISHYSPFISDENKYDHLYGCWTTRRVDGPISGLEGLKCEEQCHNVSLHSKLRANYLGTCIGFSTITVPYNDSQSLVSTNLFPDKVKNLNGFTFRSYGSEIQPFLVIDSNANGTYTLRGRDGLIWSTIAKLMNFTIDLTPGADEIKKPFNYGVIIQNILNFAYRKIDLYLIPIYLFNIVVVEVDYTSPFAANGVCVLSKRAGFETTILNTKLFKANRIFIIQFVCCIICIWVIFSIYQRLDKVPVNTLDQIGKDLLNAFRNVLMINLHNPPRRRSFRLFLSFSIWGFFVLNFALQAIIISFLTAAKTGREVETFQDIIDKGYLIYGIPSPDLIHLDTEERYRIINSRIVPVLDIFACAKNITYDSHRFCLVDCALGDYLERNFLNDDGEQYLHIAKDRFHSHYLTLMLMKHSPMTDLFTKYLSTFYEAGLIRKWAQYRFTDIKNEPSTKPLGMDDFKLILEAYWISNGIVFSTFFLELLIFYFNVVLKYCLKKKRNA